MKKVRFSNTRKFIRGKGFATALVLSIGAIGASAYIAYNSTITKLSETPNPNENAIAVENPQDGIPKETINDNRNNPANIDNVTEANARERSPETKPQRPISTEPAEEANRFIRPENPKVMPVEGEVLVPFSNGELVKSNTLGVWRTHDAVDISSELGCEVKAIQRGVVSEVADNPMWGVCITIDHGDGVFSSYMGLDKELKVKEGDEIEAGDVIALVGKTAEAEIADPPHLHFAVKKNDMWIDPIEYIAT